MHRVNVTFSDKDWAKLKRFCKSLRPYQPVGTTIREILLQDVTACNTVLQPVPCPDPACAPEQSTQVVVVVEKTTTDPVTEIAELFTSLDWRDAALPQRLTPMVYAAQLLEMFPDKDLPQQIKRAQIWHLDRRPSWKRLAHSLNNWLAKPTPEWEKEGQRSMFGPTPQSEQQDYSKGVDENGRW